MAFRFFHEYFSDLAAQETRVFRVLPGVKADIPPDEYGLLEMYCDEPGCDCRRVHFSVFAPAHNRTDAVVAWGWEDLEYYEQWLGEGGEDDAKQLKGPVLNIGSHAAAYAPALLSVVSDILDGDPAYVERIKRHYALFRARLAPKALNAKGDAAHRQHGASTEAQHKTRDETASQTYEDPVRQLLHLGEVKRPPADYAALGIGPAQIPELLRMASDASLLRADTESDEEWAPIHAWRALGQLQARETIEPLVELLRLADEDDDWAGVELSEALSAFGAEAIPPLTAYLEDPSRGLWGRVAAGEGLAKIGGRHPQERDTCVAALTRQLERFADNDGTFNGLLISNLVDLEAVESAPTMERAFAANAVDLFVIGDWEDAQIELGLLESRITPLSPPAWFGPAKSAPRNTPSQGSGKTDPKKKKKKRKEQRKSRKKNRKK